jgi:hypothetical protein
VGVNEAWDVVVEVRLCQGSAKVRISCARLANESADQRRPDMHTILNQPTESSRFRSLCYYQNIRVINFLS